MLSLWFIFHCVAPNQIAHNENNEGTILKWYNWVASQLKTIFFLNVCYVRGGTILYVRPKLHMLGLMSDFVSELFHALPSINKVFNQLNQCHIYLPPYPTVPSHRSTSHTEQPCSTESTAELFPELITSHAVH